MSALSGIDFNLMLAAGNLRGAREALGKIAEPAELRDVLAEFCAEIDAIEKKICTFRAPLDAARAEAEEQRKAGEARALDALRAARSPAAASQTG